MTDLHALPLGDLVDHDATRECWCHPVLEQTCPECEGEGGSCARCGGECVVPMYDPKESCSVHHNRVSERATIVIHQVEIEEEGGES